jgi:hypothetical protein
VGKFEAERAPAAARGKARFGGGPRRGELRRRPAGMAGGEAWWHYSRKEALPFSFFFFIISDFLVDL